MADKFKNKYRIKSARHPNWDYGSNGAYFITICTANRRHFFGNVVDEKMVLSPMGEIANQHWLEIPLKFSFAKLDVHQIMPNHIHGILIIDWGTCDGHAITGHKSPIGGITGKNNPMITNTIGTILRWYKGRCTFEIRKIHAAFAWQSRYHDHIIRDDRAFQRIANYIRNNPTNWEKDENY